MLAQVVARARRIQGVTDVVVATSVLPEDDAIEELCGALACRCTRGSPLDVLSRYAAAANATDADAIVRITSDCPLLSPAVSTRVVAKFAEGLYDYVSNTQVRTYPRGLDTEVFTRAALDDANREATVDAEREHVTPFIYWRPERFRVHQVTDIEDRNSWRWTVDTPEDYEFASRICAALADKLDEFEYADVLDTLGRHPEWRAINAHIAQKAVVR